MDDRIALLIPYFGYSIYKQNLILIGIDLLLELFLVFHKIWS